LIDPFSNRAYKYTEKPKQQCNLQAKRGVNGRWK